MRQLHSSTRLTDRALRAKPDDYLVARWRDGCERAFEEIVKRHRGELVALAATISGAHRAEDVVQVAMVKANEAVCRTAPDTRLRPWLYAIVRNAALDDARREERLQRTLEMPPGPPCEPADVLAQRERLSNLVAGLRRLPNAQRAALVQRELEGRSYKEISLSLDTTPAGARGLIFRARRHLRDGLGAATPIALAQGILARIADRVAKGAGAGGGTAATTSSGMTAAFKAGAVVAIGAFGAGASLVSSGGDSPRDSGSAAGQLEVASPNAAARVEGLILQGPHGNADESAGRARPQSDSDAGGEARRQPADVADASLDVSGHDPAETADLGHSASQDEHPVPATGTGGQEGGDSPEPHPDLVGSEHVPPEPEPVLHRHGAAAGHDTVEPTPTALPAG